MRFYCLAVIAIVWAAVFVAADARASESPQIAPPDPWVNAVSIPKPNQTNPGAPLQFLLTDRQDFFGPDSMDNYIETAVLFQTAEGLGGGSIAIPWHPDTSDLIIHHVKIIRGKEKIDVLAAQSFTVLQREPNLEIAMLDGVMTAALQPEGLRVGDILSLAWTVKYSNPVFQNRANQIIPYITGAAVNEFRLRQVWPRERAMRWQASTDLPQPTIRKTMTGTELSLTLKDLKPPAVPRGAPAHYGVTATLETTDFKSWSEISTLFAPLFAKAAQLKPGSPLDAEAKKIAAQTDDKVKRTELALKLVQEQIRYVFVGIESGGYVPVSAEKTWARRYGDCKAKTSVLIALLRALDIEAEPALVSSMLGGDLNNRLPVIGLFDHVIVRTEIEGEEYWLDGTRSGDISLARIEVPAYYWALPLREAGAELTEVRFKAPDEPTYYVEMKIDASNGLAEAAPVTAKMIMRGDRATSFRSYLNSLPDSQKNEQLKMLWRRTGLPDVKTSDMSDDDQTGDLSFSMTGALEVPSEAYIPDIFYWIPNGGFQWSADALDDGGQDRQAPWVVPYPFFEHAITTIKLPNNGDDFRPDDRPFSVAHAGFEMARKAVITDGQLTMERTTKITEPELSAADARVVVAQLSEFITQRATFSKPNPASGTTHDDVYVETAGDYLHRGLLYLNDGQIEKAYADFDQAIKLEPGSSQGHANRGRASFYLRNYTSARGDFKKALSINETNTAALTGMGHIHSHESDHESALIYFDRVIALIPEESGARKNRARAYSNLERYGDALGDIDVVLKNSPDDELTHLLKSQLLRAMSKFEEAVDAISAAIALSPDNFMHLSARSSLYDKMGNTDLALADLDRLVALSPDDATSKNNRCWIRASHNIELEKALSDCNHALKLAPDEAAFLNSRALAYLQMTEFEKAIADYDNALANSPSMDELEKEIAQYHKALEHSPSQVSSLYGRGIAKLRLGDEDGQADLDAAIALSPEIAKRFEDYGVAPE